MADSLGINPGEVDRASKPYARKDGELMRRIDAIDIKARIGFCVAELLRLGEHLGELVRGLAHRRQNKIRGPVENAIKTHEPVSGETLAQRLDHRYPAGDRGLEGKSDTLFLGLGGEGGSVMRHQRLVGGDDVLAMVECGIDHLPGDAVGAADQLDDDVDLGIGCHRRRIFVPAHRRQIDPAIAAPIAGGNRDDDEPASSPLSQEVSLPVEQLRGAGADRPQARDGDLQRRFHDGDGSLSIELFRELSCSLAGRPKQAVYVNLPYTAVRRESAQCSSSTSARLSIGSAPDGAASTAILSAGIPAVVKAAATAWARSSAARKLFSCSAAPLPAPA